MSARAVLEALPLAAAALRLRQWDGTATAEPGALEPWRPWLETLFPTFVAAGFGAHHAAFWDWVWAVEPGVRPRPFVAIWPRGGAKSTSAELACVALGARRRRRYGLYISATQDRADDHVGTVARMLESRPVERADPALASRMVGKYGSSRGWRRNRLRTAAGFTLDAIGLDVTARGAKLDEDRPDLLVLDDVDDALDAPATVERHVATLTRTLLPAGAPDLAVLAVQNLVHPDGVFAQLADERAEFLADRLVSGPHPALHGLAYEQRDGRTVLVAGEPIWAGQTVARCQDLVDDIGISAFLAECQHEVATLAGGMFDHLDFRHRPYEDLPDLVRVVVWVDPAVTDTDASDSHGIQADGLAADGTIYRLWSWEARTSPEDSLRRAILKAAELGAEVVGVETDQGGDTWEPLYQATGRRLLMTGDLPPGAGIPPFRAGKAGAGHGPKAHRASQMLADYERGQIVHVLGTHGTLERALRRFPRAKPFDLVDAAWWAWQDLRQPATPAVLAHGKARGW